MINIILDIALLLSFHDNLLSNCIGGGRQCSNKQIKC